MKVALFGATGQTGWLVLNKLLEKSHQVTALARTPSKISVVSPDLKIIEGDSLNPADVERTIDGCDAVISVLGPVSLKPSTLMEKSLGNIVKAMEAKGKKRIISTGSVGILNEMGGVPGMIIGFILRNVLKDHRKAYTILHESSLEWTVIRPITLTNGPETGHYRIADTGMPKDSRTISRSDVAGFIVKTLENGEYIRQSPCIAD